MGKLADILVVDAWRSLVLGIGKARQGIKTTRGKAHIAGVDLWPIAKDQGLINRRIFAEERAVKTTLAGRRLHGETVKRTKAEIIEIVIILDHNVFIAQLGDKVHGVGPFKGAQHRLPLATIGPDRPNAPDPLIP